MSARCLRSRDVFCNAATMRSSGKNRSSNGAKCKSGTAELSLQFGSQTQQPTMVACDNQGSAVDKEDRRSSSGRKKRRKTEDKASLLSTDLYSGAKEIELVDALCAHRKEETNALEHRKELLAVSSEILSKEDKLMAQLAELRQDKRACNTRLGEVLSKLDTCRTDIEATEAELAAVREEKSQEDAGRTRASEKELKRQCADAVVALEREKDKRICQICMNTYRDALVLPCMHFLYCSECLQEHQTTRNDCPTCRGPITALLLCKLSPD